MKKIIFIIIISILVAVILVALAGMYKFNYLSGKPGRDVDGNKTSILSEKEARAIAEKSCIKGGEALSARIMKLPKHGGLTPISTPRVKDAILPAW